MASLLQTTSLAVAAIRFSARHQTGLLLTASIASRHALPSASLAHCSLRGVASSARRRTVLLPSPSASSLRVNGSAYSTRSLLSLLLKLPNRSFYANILRSDQSVNAGKSVSLISSACSRSKSTLSSSYNSYASEQEPTSKWVGYHSLFLAFLVYTIVIVGGLTRLTESGLSITEWNPGFNGMWLPRTEKGWEVEWAKYRETPEFVLLNAKMSLDDFKSIYMWEWSHRILGRVIGLAYVIPAAFFVVRGMVKPPFQSKLLLIGLGIGAQGAMGWYMVKSGLAAPEGTHGISETSTEHTDALAPLKSSTAASWTPRVSHLRLAAHLGLAFLVYAGMLRTGLSVLRQYNLATNVGRASGLATGPGVREQLTSILSKGPVRKYHRFVGAVTGLVFLTAISGALVAGLDAGLVYNEFPTMGEGRIAPPLDEMFDERYAMSAASSSSEQKERPSSGSLVAHNLTQNPVTVQFVHRCLAITTLAHVLALAWKTRNLSGVLRTASIPLPPAIPRLAYLAAATATAQATLGVTTLIYMVPIELASAHQAGSVALLSVMLALWGTLCVPNAPGLIHKASQITTIASAASSGSASATAAAAHSPKLARIFHSTVAKRTPLSQHLILPFPSRRLFSIPAGLARPARRALADLPDKVKLKTGPAGRLAKVLAAREGFDITTRVGSSYGGNHTIQWLQQPRNLLIVTKPYDKEILEALRKLIAHINATYTGMNVIVEQMNGEALQSLNLPLTVVQAKEKPLLASKVDIIVTLGGDGTILHASSLFDISPVPPVLSFSMGTLGFLLPWHIDSFKSAMDDLINSRVILLLRMRLRQTLHEADGALVAAVQESQAQEVHLMNEVTLHRGRQPHMTTIDAFVNSNHLTQAISDGLIIASPTGSTAYSLSAGGPIVHPSVQSLLLTPICPRSLSFRPVLLPSDSTIQLKISPTSRSPAELTIDGREVRVVQPGQFLEISMSPYPIPCVSRSSLPSSLLQQQRHKRVARSGPHSEPTLAENDAVPSHVERAITNSCERAEDDWVSDINQLLRFNASFARRGLLGGTTTTDEGAVAAQSSDGR